MALLKVLLFVAAPCLFLFPALTLSASSVVNNGISVTLNDIPYFISPYAAGTLPKDPSGLEGVVQLAGLYPITVLPDSPDNFSAVVDSFTTQDDVFQSDFLQIVYTKQSPHELEIPDSYGVKTVIQLDATADLAPGPYFFSTIVGQAYPVYRLYSDFAGAFSESLLEGPDGNFTVLSATIAGAASLTIGVPSRLYYEPTPEKPLAGVRIGIKDIFDVAGARTSCGNRAFYGLYPPKLKHSVIAQKLVDAGAVLVGKQKTSQFANGENPTADWVDFHAPFNARGDGYQDTSSSSSGAGSSISSYDWLDVAVGSDTGGSIRGPAAVQGLYGNRPTRGAVDLTGAMPLSPALDTCGFLTRDPELWQLVQATVYGASPTYSSYPSTIYTAGFPTNATTPADAVALDFLDKLTEFLSANVSVFNITTAWAEGHPANTSADINDFLNITYATFISKQQSALVRDPFYADYGAIHDGRLPFVNPNALTRWTYADTRPDSDLDDAYANKTAFMEWFNGNVVVADKETCSDSFLLYLGTKGIPDARNIYTPPPIPPFGFESPGQFSVFSECPDSVFPIGQSSYASPITAHEEFIPVAIDILAARGCDSIIAQLANDLVKAGILNKTEVGQTIYGGEILLRRDV